MLTESSSAAQAERTQSGASQEATGTMAEFWSKGLRGEATPTPRTGKTASSKRTTAEDLLGTPGTEGMTTPGLARAGSISRPSSTGKGPCQPAQVRSPTPGEGCSGQRKEPARCSLRWRAT
jgi:hypothetical protein